MVVKTIKKQKVYSDGDVEIDILNLFKKPNPQKLITKILENNPSWPLKYHLSPIRENLLNWYDFGKAKTILEIGAGCGALTGLFCKKLKSVVAVELSKRRSSIIKSRFSKQTNLEVIQSNIEEVRLKEKYDYVTSIGVLEYAGKYISSSTPFLDFIKILKEHLKSDGILIVAIENRYGLKYWAGAPEDHTNRHFDSIEGYPNDKGIRTFGKYEIASLLKKVGFKNLSFYYPLPDYKFPEEIYSDQYLPNSGFDVKAGIYPSYHPTKREYLFNEKLVISGLLENQMFDLFSNSFLIFAS